MNKADILFFIEDPGAANMLMDLPKKIEKRGKVTKVLSINFGAKFLKEHSIHCEELKGNESAEQILEKYQPSLIITGTSENKDSIGLKLIESAKNRKILTVAMIDMYCNAPLRFKGKSDNPLHYAPNWLIVTDKRTKEEFIRLGFVSKRIKILGHPQIDRIRESKKYFLKKFSIVNKKRPRWLFISEGISLLNPMISRISDDYTLKGRGDTEWRTGIILEEILDVVKSINPTPNLVVRPHPKIKREDFNKWKDEISFDEILDPLESIWFSDLVLGMSSNLLVQAAALGRPVLSVLPKESEKNFLTEIHNGFIPSVFNKDKLREYLTKDLKFLSANNLFNSKKNYNVNEKILNFLFSNF